MVSHFHSSFSQTLEPTSHGLPTDVCMVVVIMVVGGGGEGGKFTPQHRRTCKIS